MPQAQIWSGRQRTLSENKDFNYVALQTGELHYVATAEQAEEEEENPWSEGGIWNIPIKRRGHTRHCGSPRGIVPPTTLTFVLRPLSKRPVFPHVRTEAVYAWL